MPYEFKAVRRVEFSDTDMAGIVHFANFFRYMETAEHGFYRSLGFSVIMDQLDPPVGDQLSPLPELSASHQVKRNAARGGLVAITSQGVKFILRIGSMIVLARFLTPSEFGIVGMATVLTGFLGMLKDAGLSSASS